MNDEKRKPIGEDLLFVEYEICSPEQVRYLKEKPGELWVQVDIHHGVGQSAIVELDAGESEPPNYTVGNDNPQGNLVQQLFVLLDQEEKIHFYLISDY